MNQILRAENVDKVTVVGGSGAGVIAQAYFKRNYSRIEAMVVYNTLAPRSERNRRWPLWMLRFLPARITGAIAKKKLETLFPGEVPPEARIALARAFLNEVISEKFNKNMAALVCESRLRVQRE